MTQLYEKKTEDVVKIDNTFASDIWRQSLLRENFMDKSINLQPNEILKTMRESFKNIMKNPQHRDLKRALAAFALSFNLSGFPMAANAEEPLVLKTPTGQVSYSSFIDAVQKKEISNV